MARNTNTMNKMILRILTLTYDKLKVANGELLLTFLLDRIPDMSKAGHFD